jgi:uncharacterized membrane protein
MATLKRFFQYGARSLKALLVSIIVASFASGFGAFQAVNALQRHAPDYWVGTLTAATFMFMAIANSWRLLRLIPKSRSDP